MESSHLSAGTDKEELRWGSFRLPGSSVRVLPWLVRRARSIPPSQSSGLFALERDYISSVWFAGSSLSSVFHASFSLFFFSCFFFS